MRIFFGEGRGACGRERGVLRENVGDLLPTMASDSLNETASDEGEKRA